MQISQTTTAIMRSHLFKVDMESLLVTGQVSVLVVGKDVLSATGEVGSKCTYLTDNYCEDAYDLLQNPVLKKLLLAGILLDTQNLKASASISMTRDAETVQLLLVGSAPNYRYALFDQLIQDQNSTSFVEALNHNYGKAPDESVPYFAGFTCSNGFYYVCDFSFEKSPRHDAFVPKFEAELSQFCEKLVRRVKPGQQRLAQEVEPAPPRPLTAEKSEQLSVLEEKIKNLLEQVEYLGEVGKIDEAKALMRKVETLNAEETALTQPQNEKVLLLAQETKMAFCEICGSFLVANDAAERTQSHITGKQHVGYGMVRDFIKEFKVNFVILDQTLILNLQSLVECLPHVPCPVSSLSGLRIAWLRDEPPQVDMESLLVTSQVSVLVVGKDVLSATGEVGSQCTYLTDNYCEDAYDLLQNPVLKKLLARLYSNGFYYVCNFSFEKSPRHDAFVPKFEAELSQFCKKLVEPAPPRPLTAEKSEQLSVLEEKIKNLLEQVESLGEVGKIDEAEALMRKVETLNAEETALTQPQNGKGVVDGSGDEDGILTQSHITGKQHVGYGMVRDFIKEFKVNFVILEQTLILNLQSLVECLPHVPCPVSSLSGLRIAWLRDEPPQVQVRCSLVYMDFEGHSDGRSIKNILSRVAPLSFEFYILLR
ncbi:hypothetical protein RIF29_26466 [Crotalaria pallida]|uniref:Uncharacterized protein n=1 Tax=Crotalaria pallida TaxID=3830 RepID=A0AAN9EMR1_CROPI